MLPDEVFISPSFLSDIILLPFQYVAIILYSPFLPILIIISPLVRVSDPHPFLADPDPGF